MANSIYDCTEHTIPCNHIRHYPRSTFVRQETVLHLAVKQYTPRYEVQDGDVTILACHANAFPKELYEPIWQSLFERVQQNLPGQRIRGIWIADVANQGQSGILNQQDLGNEPSWFDHARDYLGLVNHFREHMIRPIVGFGHSMGGTVLVNLALLHPRLLTTIVAFEPAINTAPAEMNFQGTFPLTIRRDRWPSKDAAMASITKSPFYAHWDPRVLGLYRQYDLQNMADAGLSSKDTVTLTTTKHQAVLSFARAAYPSSLAETLEDWQPSRAQHPDLGADRHPSTAFYRPEATITFQQLPFLRPSCYFLYGAKSHMSSANAKSRADKLRQTGTQTEGSGGASAGRVKELLVHGSHFVPFERPAEIALLTWQWFADELKIWNDAETAEAEAWQAISVSRRSTVSDEWIQWVQKLYGKPPNKSAKL